MPSLAGEVGRRAGGVSHALSHPHGEQKSRHDSEWRTERPLWPPHGKQKGHYAPHDEQAEPSHLPKDTYKIQQLKSQLYNFMIEARHLKIENHEILQWIDEITTELGGAENESHESI